MVIYRNVVECLNEVIERNRAELINIDGSLNVKAIGITNQRETTVAWNKRTGEPLHNAVVWLDNRTADIIARLKQELGDEALERMRQRCGLPLNTYFSGVKMRWLLENSPSVQALVQSDPQGSNFASRRSIRGSFR